MTLYRCKPLKMEDTEPGAFDMTPTELNTRTEGVDSGAFFLQQGATADSTCYLDRDPADGGMRATDAVQGTRRVPDLVSRTLGAPASHQALVDIVHFLDEGPGDGWTSGAFRTSTYSGMLLTASIWWTSSAMTQRIIALAVAYAAGSLVPASQTWSLYSGSSVVRSLTDTYAYSGLLCTSVVRTWS